VNNPSRNNNKRGEKGDRGKDCEDLHEKRTNTKKKLNRVIVGNRRSSNSRQSNNSIHLYTSQEK